MITIKQKLVVVQSVSLITVYMILRTFEYIFMGVTMPFYMQYVSIGAISILAYIQYVVADKISEPIRYLCAKAQNYNPKKPPSEIMVMSNDELGILTAQFNINRALIWETH